MPFSELDSAGIARALSQIAERPADLADAFFERSEIIELPPADATPGLRVWRESGLAIRLLRDGHTWLAGRDRIDKEAFQDALRRVARAMPRVPYPQPEFPRRGTNGGGPQRGTNGGGPRRGTGSDHWSDPPHAPEVLELPAAVDRALRARRMSVPLRLTVCRHRRWVRVIGTQLTSGTECEKFYSLRIETPWARFGLLLDELATGAADTVAGHLFNLHRARDAPPPAPRRGVSILGAAATAVLLHEAVSHALEADTLAQGGHPEAAVGVRMGSGLLNVFDDPSSAPENVRRAADDEGYPVVRRCLLRAGVVEQPLADTSWARRSDLLVAGGGRRSNRHQLPQPRSAHLELVPGESSLSELLAGAEGGLYLPEAERGRLDPLTGDFTLFFPYGRRIRNQAPGPPVGPCALRGRVGDLLERVNGVGSQARAGGAGWCAKGGMKLPVWATCPELRLEGVEIRP